MMLNSEMFVTLCSHFLLLLHPTWCKHGLHLLFFYFVVVVFCLVLLFILLSIIFLL